MAGDSDGEGKGSIVVGLGDSLGEGETSGVGFGNGSIDELGDDSGVGDSVGSGVGLGASERNKLHFSQIYFPSLPQPRQLFGKIISRIVFFN